MISTELAVVGAGPAGLTAAPIGSVSALARAPGLFGASLQAIPTLYWRIHPCGSWPMAWLVT